MIVTILVVVLSLAALFLIAISAEKCGLKSLRIWAVICLVAMLIGPIGTGMMPQAVFGIFERIGTFSVVIFNAVLGVFLMVGRLDESK